MQCVSSSLFLSFTQCKVLNLSSWFTQLWANCCHPQQLCAQSTIRRQKLIQKNLVSLLCLYPAASFADPILSHSVCSASENQGVSWSHLNNIPQHPQEVCEVLFLAALLLLPSKAPEQSCQGFGLAGPCGPQKGNQKAVLAKEVLHLRKLSPWEDLGMRPSSPVRSHGSTTERARWRENLVPQALYPQVLKYQADSEFQMVSPNTQLNERFSQAPAMCG